MSHGRFCIQQSLFPSRGRLYKHHTVDMYLELHFGNHQLRDADINIIGENLSKLHSMTFEMPNKGRIAINFETGGHDRFGDFSNEDEIEVYRILSSWGI